MNELTAIELLDAQVRTAHGEARSRAQGAVLRGYLECARGWEPQEDTEPYRAGWACAATIPVSYSSLAMEMLAVQRVMVEQGDLAASYAERTEFVDKPISEETWGEIPF